MKVFLGIFHENKIICSDGSIIPTLLWRRDRELVEGYECYFQLEEKEFLGHEKPEPVIKNFIPLRKVDVSSYIKERIF